MGRQTKKLFEFGPFRLDTERKQLLQAGQVVPLPPKAVAVLTVLLQRPGRVVEKQELLEIIWPDAMVEEANLTQTVYVLRKALSQNGNSQPLIETLPRLGYRLVAEVREVAEEEIAPVITPWTAMSEQVSLPEETIEPHASATESEPVSSPATTALELAPLNHGDLFPAPFAPSPLPPRTAELFMPATPKRSLPRTWLFRVSSATIIIILLLVTGVVLSRQQQTTVEVYSLAVLPFTLLDTQTKDRALSVGLADALITKLAEQKKVQIRPTTAILPYENSKVDALVAGRELDVNAVLTGNVHRQSGRVRVTVQLLRVADGHPLWVEVFDEAETRIFELEDRLAEHVGRALPPPTK